MASRCMLKAARFLKICKRTDAWAPKFLTFLPPFRSNSSVGKAPGRLLKCLNEEIRVEKKASESLPTVGKFRTEVKGTQATLTQSLGQEKIQVQLDANSAIEVMQEDMEEGGEPLFVPTFTVTISKPSGSSVQFDCSFDEYSSFEEQGNEWESIQIDSVTVLPDVLDGLSAGNVYSVDAENLNEDLYSALVEYLKEHGIDEKFATDILQFYVAFEHKRYVDDFLKPLKLFITNN